MNEVDGFEAGGASGGFTMRLLKRPSTASVCGDRVGAHIRKFPLPLRFGVANLVVLGLSMLLWFEPNAPLWAITIAGGIGGFVAGLLKQ